ncbi:MAG: response regulator [Frankiales bacterium]|nr:response regulator [Frankiales bacterium]
MARILLIEDDDTIGAALESALGASGYQVRWHRSGGSGLIEAREAGADLVLLDLGLPDRDGIDVCRELRSRQPTAVIVILTARQDEMDVISGLDAGADDYLTKPFKVSEVLARIRAHLRRSNTALSVPAQPAELRLGSLVIDVASRRVHVAQVEVGLRARELDLLLRLATDAGVAVSRETLMSDVWDEHWFGSTKTLDVHMVALRRKLSDAAALAGAEAIAALPAVTTLRGHGYRLDPPTDT